MKVLPPGTLGSREFNNSFFNCSGKRSTMSSGSDVEMQPAVPSQPKKKIKKNPSRELLKKDHGKKTTRQMLHEALRELNTRKGVSLYAIKKFVIENNEVNKEKINYLIKKSLKSEVESGAIVQLKGIGASGSFKLPPKSKGEKSEKKKKNVKTMKVEKINEHAKVAKPDKPKKLKEAPSKENKVAMKKKVVEKTIAVKKKETSKKTEIEKVSKSAKKSSVVKKDKNKAAAQTAAQKRSSIMKRKSIGSIIKAPKMKPKAR